MYENLTGKMLVEVKNSSDLDLKRTHVGMLVAFNDPEDAKLRDIAYLLALDL
jgi:hypothetical protein